MENFVCTSESRNQRCCRRCCCCCCHRCCCRRCLLNAAGEQAHRHARGCMGTRMRVSARAYWRVGMAGPPPHVTPCAARSLAAHRPPSTARCCYSPSAVGTTTAASILAATCCPHGGGLEVRTGAGLKKKKAVDCGNFFGGSRSSRVLCWLRMGFAACWAICKKRRRFEKVAAAQQQQARVA